MTGPRELGSSSTDTHEQHLPTDTHEQPLSTGKKEVGLPRGVWNKLVTGIHQKELEEQKIQEQDLKAKEVPPSSSNTNAVRIGKDLSKPVNSNSKEIVPKNIQDLVNPSNKILQESSGEQGTGGTGGTGGKVRDTSNTPLDIPSSKSSPPGKAPEENTSLPTQKLPLRRRTVPPNLDIHPSGRESQQDPLSPGKGGLKRSSTDTTSTEPEQRPQSPLSPLSPSWQAGRGRSRLWDLQHEESGRKPARSPFGRDRLREIQDERPGSADSTRSSYVRNKASLYDMLNTETGQKLRELEQEEVALYSSEAPKIIAYIQEHKATYNYIESRIHQEQIAQKSSNWTSFWKEDRIPSLQEEQKKVMGELKKEADELQKKMEEKFKERVKIIQESGLVKEEKKREDGFVFRFSDQPFYKDPEGAIFQQAVHNWVTRKQANLADVSSAGLEQRLNIRYQSERDDTPGRAQEYAKWHLALIKYLDSGEYTKYRETDPNTGRLIIDPSTRQPIIREHTGEKAKEAKELVWKAIEKNAKALSDLLLPRKAMVE